MKAGVLACLLAAAAQASGHGVGGVVVDSISRQPVANAHVTITSLEHRDRPMAFVTGADGRFVFAGMAPGKYELKVQHARWLPADYSGALVVGAGQRTDAIVLAMAAPGAISGKVVDDAGEPVEHAAVQLLFSRISGSRHMAPVAVTYTTDTGAYRFGGLPAGSYYLAASGYPWYAKFNQTHGDAPPRAITHSGYAVRCYPDGGDPLQLHAGQESTVELTLLSVPAVTIQVHVTGGEDLTKQFALSKSGVDGNPVPIRQGTETGDLYNIWSVPPGHYTLLVKAADANHTWIAREPIDAVATDLEIAATLREAPALTGTVTPEDGSSLPPGMSVLVTDTETGATQSIAVGLGGKFAVAAIEPQRCRLAFTGAGEYYLKESSRGTLDIPAGPGMRLQLIAVKGTGRVNGKVYRDGSPLAGAMVRLADAANTENVRMLPSDSDGGYEFKGLPPGAYSLSAVEGDGGATAAEAVRVDAGSAVSRNLEVRGTTAGPRASVSPEP